VLHNFDTAYSIPEISTKTRPGRYTFLDQMVVGVVPDSASHHGGIGGPGLTYDETVAHMSMWVMASSPLLTYNDVRSMSAAIKEVLTNPEVLAVHKDPAVRSLHFWRSVCPTPQRVYPPWVRTGLVQVYSADAVQHTNTASVHQGRSVRAPGSQRPCTRVAASVHQGRSARAPGSQRPCTRVAASHQSCSVRTWRA
jgi:hypothetical protein